MKLPLQRADEFNADFDQQYRWYVEKPGAEVTERFLRAVADTLPLLADQPDLGRRENFAIRCCAIFGRFEWNGRFRKFSSSIA